MASCGREANLCNGNKPSAMNFGKCANKEEGEAEEKESLLPLASKAMAVETRRSSMRRVQWNDDNGDKLVQVLEFDPSDSSDDEDYADTCICALM